MALALLAGCFWAAYILLAAQVGRRHPRREGLALGMAIGAVMVAPVGLADAGSGLLSAEVIAVGLAVAMLSSAIPYTLELEALRRLPAARLRRADEPRAGGRGDARASSCSDEDLAGREIVAIGLVVTASAGAARNATVPPRDA